MVYSCQDELAEAKRVGAEQAEQIVKNKKLHDTEIAKLQQEHRAQINELKAEHKSVMKDAEKQQVNSNKENFKEGRNKGIKERMVRQLDSMLHRHRNLSTSPTALMLYIQIWQDKATLDTIQQRNADANQFAAARHAKQV